MFQNSYDQFRYFEGPRLIFLWYHLHRNAKITGVSPA